MIVWGLVALVARLVPPKVSFGGPRATVMGSSIPDRDDGADTSVQKAVFARTRRNEVDKSWQSSWSQKTGENDTDGTVPAAGPRRMPT